MRHLSYKTSVLGLLMACLQGAAFGAPEVHPAQSLAELQDLLVTNDQVVSSFSVTGRVCAAHPETREVVLQDDSATVLLELPSMEDNVRSGAWLAIQGTNTTVTRSPFGIRLGTAPVVDNDGFHPPRTHSGTAYLAAGYQPFRLEYFNAAEGATLQLEYESDELPRQGVPNSVVCRPRLIGSPHGELAPGLDFAAYLGQEWFSLPDLASLKPVRTGVCSNLDLDCRPRPAQVALVFSGFLQISRAGRYSFYLRSDDGARLFVGNPNAQCAATVLPRAAQVPVPRNLSEALRAGGDRDWVTLEGKVTFAAENERRLALEIMQRDQPVSVVVLNPGTLSPGALAQQQVTVTGICQLARDGQEPSIVLLGPEQLGILNRTPRSKKDEVLTTAAQVRELQADEARSARPAKLRGVVTMATYWSCVVQDLTGGVFVRQFRDTWAEQPAPGELWEFEGRTDPGDFSPILLATNATYLGSSPMPQPLHPTWEQLVNGSMDAEFVEVQGVVSEISSSGMTLFTRDGKVKILEKASYNLPANAAPPAGEALQGSVVRVRGVYAAKWDDLTRRLNPGQFYLGNASLFVDEPAPKDPFALPTKRITDLLLFTSHVGALTRVKVAGQVMCAQGREYLLCDGTNGFRAVTKQRVPVKEGDLVQVVGFPQLTGASPLLFEAKLFRTGAAPLPAPIPVLGTDLPNDRFDGLLVAIEAHVLSDVSRLGERVLELQAGQQHFLGRLRTDGRPFTPLRRGSKLAVTAVYSAREPASNLASFELLLNRPADIAVLKPGPWWTKRHTVATITALLLGLLVSWVWIALLRRTVAQRTKRLEEEITERQRTEHRRTLEQERTRVAQDLHDDLGAGLAQISLIGALAQRPTTAPDRARQHLEEITGRSREMISALDEIVWAINPKHDNTSSVTSYFCDYAQEFLRPASIACRLDVARAQPAQRLSSIQRHQLFLAFKEALTNIVKHAHASEVWIRMTAGEGELQLKIEDNGQGMPARTRTNDNSTGEGIPGMNTRLERLGGTCLVQPRPEGGTSVSFRIPTTPKIIRHPRSDGQTNYNDTTITQL